MTVPLLIMHHSTANRLPDENIRVEPEYMRDLGRENIGVAIPEGGGYIGTLNVYHEIHCLKRIHQFMYPEHYFPEFTPHQHEINRLHNGNATKDTSPTCGNESLG